VRAVVYDRYGPPDVLHVEDVDAPIPADDEILVRTSATTVNRTDCGWRSAKPFIVRWFLGLRRPKRRILGMEFAGTVEAVGPAVTEFAVGDEVFGVKGFGAHAELVCVRESGAVAHKPKGISFEEAAAVCDGACIAFSCLRRADLRGGHRLVVYGASGSVGTASVQLAKHLGAHVTAVCNTQTLELARTLGADEVIDYLHEDFTKNGQRYDVIFDAVGKQTFVRCRRSLAPGGIFVSTDGFRNLFWMFWTKRIGDKRAALGIAKYRKDDVRVLKRLIEQGDYQAVIDRRYRLDDIVEAARYVDTGQKTGNVVMTV
jgi:NADPH:quinone reductase-like Zn-dependent oxidoreductase